MPSRVTILSVGLSVVLLGAVASAQSPIHPHAHPHGPVHARDRVYVVRPGDSVRRIAAVLQVPLRELTALNALHPPFTLSVGRRLRVPEDTPDDVLATLPLRDEVTSDGEGGTHRAGMVTLVRLRDGAETTTNFNVGGAALRNRVGRWMQARDGSTHLIHPRLLRVISALSDRFGGRRMVIVSGYRPHRGGRDEPHNRHALGYALDLRVDGVPLRAVWDYCKSLPNVGCGLSSRGNFVHVDVRPSPASWTVGSHDEPTPPEDDLHEVTEDSRAP